MSWIGWVVIVILGFNVLFFGVLITYDVYSDWRARRK